MFVIKIWKYSILISVYYSSYSLQENHHIFFLYLYSRESDADTFTSDEWTGGDDVPD